MINECRGATHLYSGNFCKSQNNVFRFGCLYSSISFPKDVQRVRGGSLVCDSQKCCAKQLLNNGHDQAVYYYIIHIGKYICIDRMSSRSFFYVRNNGRHMNYGERGYALGLASGVEFAWKNTKLTTHTTHTQQTNTHTNHTIHYFTPKTNLLRLFLDSFMQHLTRPLPLHRTLFAPMPYAPLAPLEPLRALPSQRLASVWAPPPPAPLAAQHPQSLNAPLLPIYSSSFDSDSLSDTEFVPLEQQQQQQKQAQLQGRQDAVTSAQTSATTLENRPFSKSHLVGNQLEYL